jgi:hypothetical protein
VLTIRRAQIKHFRKVASVEAALRHVVRYFPAECGTRNREQMIAFIDRAFDRASRYDLNSYQDALQFLDLTLVLGENFDTHFAWAASILGDSACEQLRFRATRLYERAIRHLNSEPEDEPANRITA